MYACQCDRCAVTYADAPWERYRACKNHLDLISNVHLFRTGTSAIWFELKTTHSPVFSVRMSGNARVHGTYRTQQATTPEEAKKEAYDRAGDVSWNYDGVDDDSIEIDAVEKIQ
jgi:hypothetical protein